MYSDNGLVLIRSLGKLGLKGVITLFLAFDYSHVSWRRRGLSACIWLKAGFSLKLQAKLAEKVL